MSWWLGRSIGRSSSPALDVSRTPLVVSSVEDLPGTEVTQSPLFPETFKDGEDDRPRQRVQKVHRRCRVFETWRSREGVSGTYRLRQSYPDRADGNPVGFLYPHLPSLGSGSGG